MALDKINVLIVDDSAVTRMHLAHLLESDERIRVMSTVANGQAAVDFVQQQRPDVVLMDIHMPGMDGFEATRRIMETQPVPIIICSASTSTKEVAVTFRAIEAGAVACVEKPVNREHADFERMAAEIRDTVKLMSEVKLVRRWVRGRNGLAPAAGSTMTQGKPAPRMTKVVGIGASTGGPLVLQTILSALPRDFPAPILIVQHISPNFLPGLADWLGQTSGCPIHIGAYGVFPLPGHVYLAPDSFHMGLASNGSILLTKEEPENGLRPAISFLFRSLAQTCGSAAVGVLLTGMGRDGATELKLMRNQGAVTIAQDQETSVVHGMPGEAIALGAAIHILAADKIAATLLDIVSRRHQKEEASL